MEPLTVYLPGILLAYSAFLISIMSPGPNILAILGTAMSAGRRSGTALALGVATGSFLWASLTVAGLSALLASFAEVLIVIKVVGGCYLLWLAFKAFRSALSDHDIQARVLPGGQRLPFAYFMRGFVVQMTNPKAALAWIAIISLGLTANAPLWVGLVIVGGTTALSILIHCAYALVFSTAGMMRVYARARRGIEGVLGVFFAFAGLKLLTGR